jgi:hypothetical protein
MSTGLWLPLAILSLSIWGCMLQWGRCENSPIHSDTNTKAFFANAGWGEPCTLSGISAGQVHSTAGLDNLIVNLISQLFFHQIIFNQHECKGVRRREDFLAPCLHPPSPWILIFAPALVLAGLIISTASLSSREHFLHRTQHSTPCCCSAP